MTDYSNNGTERFLNEASYFKCGACGYEFLSKSKNPTCPHCKSDKLQSKDIKAIAGLDQ